VTFYSGKSVSSFNTAWAASVGRKAWKIPSRSPIKPSDCKPWQPVGVASRYGGNDLPLSGAQGWPVLEAHRAELFRKSGAVVPFVWAAPRWIYWGSARRKQRCATRKIACDRRLPRSSPIGAT
jgi:hypothetical protein